MAKSAIEVRCAVSPDDCLTVRRAVVGDLLYLTTHDADEAQATAIGLDARAARELFNWLGVELHKGGLRNG